MGRQELCEIAGCGCLVMGCEEDDCCPATRLCEAHYFLMAELCEPESSCSFGLKPSDIFGVPNHWEREKLRKWYANYREQVSVGGIS